MRRLIINADDLGINPSRDHGIFEAFERGVVTSATMIVTGAGALRAAELARRAELPTGLHFNLTEGFPMSPAKNIGSLLTPDGMFLTRERLQRALNEGKVDPRHIGWEFRAQMEWFIERRGTPTHVDSHHHMHIDPLIAKILPPLLAQYSVRFVRIPDEPPPPDHLDFTEERLERMTRTSRLARESRPLFEAHGIGSTDHFRGMSFSGNASKKAFRQVLRTLSDGATEFMVHPGQCDPSGDDFSRDPQRETEREMLMDEELSPLLQAQKIDLISYADL